MQSTNNSKTDMQDDTSAGIDSASLYSYPEFETKTSIRLVILHPGAFNDPITCDIISCDLDEAPDYEALSYTWADSTGDKTLSARIWCGREMKNAIEVTTNCKAALRRLRSQDVCSVVWVDAICINQSQTRERNHQVSIMSLIYRSARRVIVYLGEGSSATDGFIDILNSEPSQIHTHVELVWLATSVFSRSWFERLWVLQEIVLARTAVVICGTRRIQWQRLAKFFVNTYEQTCDKAITSLPSTLFEHGLKGTMPVDSFLDLFMAAQSRKVSDPLDRVYALLGIIEQDIHAGFRPDYTSNSMVASYNLAVYFQNKFSVWFPPPGLSASQLNNWSLSDQTWSWMFDWNQRHLIPSNPIHFEENFSINKGEMEFKGRRVLEGFFELPQEQQGSEPSVHQVFDGYFITPPHAFSERFIVVKVSEIVGILLCPGRSFAVQWVFASSVSNLRRCFRAHGRETMCSCCSSGSQWLSDPELLVVH